MNEGQKYRQLASDCIRLAQIVSEAAEKDVLLKMAEAWLTLARRYEEGKRGSNPPNDA
jgi:hypothetical protein